MSPVGSGLQERCEGHRLQQIQHHGAIDTVLVKASPSRAAQRITNRAISNVEQPNVPQIPDQLAHEVSGAVGAASDDEASREGLPPDGTVSKKRFIFNNCFSMR